MAWELFASVLKDHKVSTCTVRTNVSTFQKYVSENITIPSVQMIKELRTVNSKTFKLDLDLGIVFYSACMASSEQIVKEQRSEHFKT